MRGVKTKLYSNKPITTKIVTLAILVLFLFMADPALAITQQEAQNQINQINQQLNEINNSLSANRQKQNTLEGEVANIDGQVQSIQLQIDATNYQIFILNNQIADTEANIKKAEEDLAHQKKVLGEYLKVMYMNGQTSTIEMIATSNSLSDFVDKSEYLSTMQQKVQETMAKITALKADLEQKKTELEIDKSKNQQLQVQQTAQKNAIVAQLNYKNSLLADAQSEASYLKDQKQALYAKKAQLSLLFNESRLTGSSAYPYGNPPAAGIIDTPDAYGYLIGECTSYSAWKRASVGRPVPRGLGNANTWGSRAAGMGYSVDSNPRVGDVMVFPYLGYYGHVAYVEAVNGDGTIIISEYNWWPYQFSERRINPYNYSGIFIH